jgi:NADPH2:quinone reductase
LQVVGAHDNAQVLYPASSYNAEKIIAAERRYSHCLTVEKILRTKAVVLRNAGGPEALQLETVAIGSPGEGQLHVRHAAIAVNFHDTYVRSGLYKTLPLPGIMGLEAAGVVEKVGTGVTGFSIGDRIAYLDSGYGAYSTERILDAARAVSLPDGVPMEFAAAFFLKGVTAAILVTEVHPIRPGQWILAHAAAGGVGRILVQWARELGARIIGTVGSPEKAEIARAEGCEVVIPYREEPFAPRVKEITGGRGVDVVFDAVGRDTFDGSLECLALRGHLVNYGQSSGPVPPFDISRLAVKSATLTRAGYAHYIPEPGDLERLANALWERVGDGRLNLRIGQRFSLADAAEAHRALEARGASPIILVP